MYTMHLSSAQIFIAIAGRMLLSLIFLMSGLAKLMDWSGTAAHMAAIGLPLAPILLYLAVTIELLGGLALLTGVLARPAAVCLVFYLIPVTLVFHGFWAVSAEQATLQLMMFLKNLAIIGGLFVVAAVDPTLALASGGGMKSGPEAGLAKGEIEETSSKGTPAGVS